MNSDHIAKIEGRLEVIFHVLSPLKREVDNIYGAVGILVAEYEGSQAKFDRLRELRSLLKDCGTDLHSLQARLTEATGTLVRLKEKGDSHDDGEH